MVRGPQAGDEAGYFYQASGAVCNQPVLSEAVTYSGFFNTLPDRDGILRRSPLLIRAGNDYYPGLALAAINQALGVKQAAHEAGARGGWNCGWAGIIIPLDEQGALLLRYRGPRRTYRYISAVDVLDDLLEPGSLNGKIVFVGTSARRPQGHPIHASGPALSRSGGRTPPSWITS